MLDHSPITQIKPPPIAKDQSDPFNSSQVNVILAAAKVWPEPTRDVAILWMLYDTGLRAEGFCRLQLSDLYLLEKHVTMLGEGNETRAVSFGLTVSRVLWAYLRDVRRDPSSLAAENPSSMQSLMRTPLFLPSRRYGSGGGGHRRPAPAAQPGGQTPEAREMNAEEWAGEWRLTGAGGSVYNMGMEKRLLILPLTVVLLAASGAAWQAHVKAEHRAELARLNADINAYQNFVYQTKFWTETTPPATAAEEKEFDVEYKKMNLTRSLYYQKAKEYGLPAQYPYLPAPN